MQPDIRLMKRCTIDLESTRRITLRPRVIRLKADHRQRLIQVIRDMRQQRLGISQRRVIHQVMIENQPLVVSAQKLPLAARPDREHCECDHNCGRRDESRDPRRRKANFRRLNRVQRRSLYDQSAKPIIRR